MVRKEIRPKDHGFSWDFGTEVKSVGNGANFWPYVFRNQPIRWIDIPNNRLGKEEYLTDRLNIEAVDFVTKHRHKPFFLLLSHYTPHHSQWSPRFGRKIPSQTSSRNIDSKPMLSLRRCRFRHRGCQSPLGWQSQSPFGSDA